MDLDFTAMPTFDYLAVGDGFYAFDGHTFEVKNAALQSSTFKITNGVGLEIVGAAWRSGSRLEPGYTPNGAQLTALLSAIAPDFSPTIDRIRVSTHFGDDGLVADNQMVGSSLGKESNYTAVAVVQKRYISGLKRRAYWGLNSSVYLDSSIDTTHDVQVIDVDPRGIVNLYTGLFSSGWPGKGAITHLKSQDALIGFGHTHKFTNFGDDMSYRFMLGTLSLPLVELKATLKRLKIEYISGK